MIAVFSRMTDFRELHLSPKSEYRIIMDLRDVRAVKFTGVIQTYNWREGQPDKVQAFDYLKKMQPELF